jgi:protein-S-isoprenylcysteine O-methyltransferase Ste14
MAQCDDTGSGSFLNTLEKLGGIGPRLALMCLPYVVLSLIVMRRYPDFGRPGFTGSPRMKTAARALGFLWLAVGVVFWAWSGVYFLRHYRDEGLITEGPFALCRNPIYSAIIVFIIPGLAVMSRSGLVLSDALVMYIGFKMSIHGEAIPLARTFGEEYEAYEKSVNELFPFPRSLFGKERSSCA